MKVSRESGQSGQTRRGFRVKVNLPTFKDEKAKDAVTYCLWWWDVSMFHHSGWDDCNLLPYVFRSLQGFPGDLARSLGKVATLGDVLKMLDEHYGVVMTFDALIKELYSLKQGMGENVAKCEVCLSQQLQILQTDYTSRIQQEYVKEVRQDCFYKGLSPEYEWMLAHKVNGENPATFSEMLLAAQKLERQTEASSHKPLLPGVQT